MPAYYGYECELCKDYVALGKTEPNEKGKFVFYTTELDPVICPLCGFSKSYGSDDLFEFEAEENIEQFPAGMRVKKSS